MLMTRALCLSSVTITADPDPPQGPGSYGGPSLPAQPVVGTGDGMNLKEAEKHAALHACLQLYSRGLFTPTNLPTRTRGKITPLNVASTGNQKNNNQQADSSGAVTYQTFAPTAPGTAPAPNDGKTIGLGNGQRISLEEARAFMDFYC